MKILGTGSEIPKLAINNNELAKFLETSDDWISSRTGICERRIISDESLEVLAVSAAKKALESACIQASELDFIFCSNVMNSYVTPALSCIIQGEINASCPCLDMNGACAGFIYALDCAQAYTESGKAKNILIVCAEETSHMLDWTDRKTSVLFGDGVGAVVVTKGDNLRSIRLTTVSNKDVLYAKQTTGNCPFEKNPVAQTALMMNGQEVYKFAVSSSANDLYTVIEQAGIQADDIKYFLIHQANIRIIEAVRQRLSQPPEKFPHNVERFGNTSSASIPILLDELNSQGLLKSGDLLALSAFGAGLVTGACVLQWN